jgi:hypothetical protein
MQKENKIALGIKLPVIIMDSMKPKKKTKIQAYSGLASRNS